MRKLTAVYLIPQLPRIVFFPAVFVVKEIAVRWDVPLTVLIALAIPGLIIVGAGMQWAVNWAKDMIMESGE